MALGKFLTKSAKKYKKLQKIFGKENKCFIFYKILRYEKMGICIVDNDGKRVEKLSDITIRNLDGFVDKLFGKICETSEGKGFLGFVREMDVRGWGRM